MNKLLLYIHGQGGNAEEAEHYKPLFPGYDVVGLPYTAQTPWEAKEEFLRFWEAVCRPYDTVTVLANSIGAFFAMNAFSELPLEKACFISPVVDMEKLITDMMGWTNVTEAELREKGTIETSFGQTLSWAYLCYVREHPLSWHIPTHILYGSRDDLTAPETIAAFARQTSAALTVMPEGEHWFHTEEQMQFLDRWLQAIL